MCLDEVDKISSNTKLSISLGKKHKIKLRNNLLPDVAHFKVFIVHNSHLDVII